MSATKSKPAGRAVGVYSEWVDGYDDTYVKKPMHPAEKRHIVTGYTGSAAKLKRLVEIAGMDYEKLVEIVNATWVTQPQDHPKGNSQARAVLATLGLSTAQGRKGKRS